VYYVFTAWSTVLLEKLTVFQLVKKFPTFYGTQLNLYITYLLYGSESFLRS